MVPESFNGQLGRGFTIRAQPVSSTSMKEKGSKVEGAEGGNFLLVTGCSLVCQIDGPFGAAEDGVVQRFIRFAGPHSHPLTMNLLAQTI